MLRHCGCVRDTDACQRPRRDRLRNGGAGGGAGGLERLSACSLSVSTEARSSAGSDKEGMLYGFEGKVWRKVFSE